MSTTVILARASDDVLHGATISGTTPAATYSLATLAGRDPASRVRFSAGTVTVTWTLGVAARGDIFVLPVSNLDPGSSVATLTNGAGLSKAITVPALQKNGLPRTVILDLTVAEPTALTRTSNVWNLVITGNSVNVILGGAVFLFTPKRTLDAMQWGVGYQKQHQVGETRNDYATRYRINYETTERTLAFSAAVDCTESPDELRDLEDFYDAGAGSTDPSLVWVQRDELDAYIGTPMGAFKAKQRQGMFVYDCDFQFAELSKGKPV